MARMEPENCAMLIRNVLISLIVSSTFAFGQTMHGVGSTLVQPLYSEWFKAYNKVNPAVRFHYKPTGFAGGISDFIDGKADFAATETPLTENEMKVARQKFGSEILHIPTVLGAVVPIYRVDGADVEL